MYQRMYRPIYHKHAFTHQCILSYTNTYIHKVHLQHQALKLPSDGIMLCIVCAESLTEMLLGVKMKPSKHPRGPFQSCTYTEALYIDIPRLRHSNTDIQTYKHEHKHIHKQINTHKHKHTYTDRQTCTHIHRDR